MLFKSRVQGNVKRMLRDNQKPRQQPSATAVPHWQHKEYLEPKVLWQVP